MLTSKMYAEKSGKNCPLCGSANLTLGEENYAGEQMMITMVSCAECDARWEEINQVLVVGYMNLIDGDGISVHLSKDGE